MEKNVPRKSSDITRRGKGVQHPQAEAHKAAVYDPALPAREPPDNLGALFDRLYGQSSGTPVQDLVGRLRSHATALSKEEFSRQKLIEDLNSAADELEWRRRSG